MLIQGELGRVCAKSGGQASRNAVNHIPSVGDFKGEWRNP